MATDFKGILNLDPMIRFFVFWLNPNPYPTTFLANLFFYCFLLTTFLIQYIILGFFMHRHDFCLRRFEILRFDLASYFISFVLNVQCTISFNPNHIAQFLVAFLMLAHAEGLKKLDIHACPFIWLLGLSKKKLKGPS